MAIKSEMTARFLQVVDYLIKNKVEPSARQLMLKSGSNSQTLSELRGERQHVSLTLVNEICRHYGVNLSWIVLGEGSMFSANDVVHNDDPSVFARITVAEIRDRIMAAIEALMERDGVNSLHGYVEKELGMKYSTFMAYKNRHSEKPPKDMFNVLEKAGVSMIFLFMGEEPVLRNIAEWTSKDKEITYLKEQNSLLKELNQVLKDRS